MEKKMLLQDISDFLSVREKITKKKADNFVRCLFEVIEEGLLTDSFVKIKGFGTFKLIEVSDRESIDVNTGERIQINGHGKVTFTPDNNLKELVNRPFSHFQTVILNEETTIEELESIDHEYYNNMDVVENDDDHDMITDKNSNKESETTVHLPDFEVYKDENSENVTDYITILPETDTTEVLSNEQENLTEQSTVKTSDPILSNESSVIEMEVEYKEKEEDTHWGQLETNEENIKEYNEENNEEINEQTQAAQIDSSLQSESDKEATNDSNDVESITTDSSSEQSPMNIESTQNEHKDSIEDKNANNKDINLITTTNTDKKETEITYVVRENEHKIWKGIAFVLMMLILMTLSYFAGYYKLFCPCEIFHSSSPIEEPTQTVSTITTTETNSSEKPIAADSSQTVVSTNSSTTAQDSKEENNSVAPLTSTKEVSIPQSSKEAPIPPSASQNFAQVEGAKYEIIGTQSTHTIKAGETIRTIALDVYGSKGYAPYIIVHNKITDPNNIEVGMVLQLPLLKYKK